MAFFAVAFFAVAFFAVAFFAGFFADEAAAEGFAAGGFAAAGGAVGFGVVASGGDHGPTGAVPATTLRRPSDARTIVPMPSRRGCRMASPALSSPRK